MRTRKLLLTTITFLMASTMIFAQEIKTEKIKVLGNCGMCENRIEKAASGIEGVTKADWNKETKMLEVTFDENKVKIDDVHEAVAKAGHDTKKVKAKNETYNGLPGCCKYERE